METTVAAPGILEGTTQVTAPKKVVNAWAMYDWANSAYNLVITSTIFPAYYEAITGDDNEQTIDHVTFLGRSFVNTSLYNYALAVAFLIVALVSPLLSSIADTRGNKKSFMGFFMTMGSLACASLFFFDRGTPHFLFLGIASMIVACVGYWASLVFYNSYLPEIAAPQDRDRISARGFSFGYVGSVLLQIICFLFVMKPDLFGIPKGTLGARISFLAVALWWFGFALLPLRRLPRRQVRNVPKAALLAGYQELRKVFAQLSHIPVLKRYLGSFFFYNMGVQTVMLAATLYGKGELKIPTQNLIIAIVVIQLIAIPGALLISRLSARIGNLKALMVCVLFWIGCCIAGYALPAHSATHPDNDRCVMSFYGLAVAVGFVMGGIQSLSRSTYSKLMPETKDTTSFFSFFDVTEKIAIVIGMFSFGIINELTGSQRNSVLTLVLFFALGLIGLWLTLRKQREAGF
ncbi:MFS transporter [Flaviaesturariibacter aridisoli]|uniref:MFS transporter n=1 Tax=Flaviaesturariibacter aridisoli TaxID=2545761 RepID=A0A4R4E598_9BACT|nr:MFS transporter [Flaviaesturariibacter aridisoli]TCZ74804.1 MFS transporter [Flaviaesturariibacter aridisoli]